jgi:hypothetical protein
MKLLLHAGAPATSRYASQKTTTHTAAQHVVVRAMIGRNTTIRDALVTGTTEIVKDATGLPINP